MRDPRLSAKRYTRALAHFSDEEKRRIGTWTRAAENMMVFMDTPSHTRVRKLLLRAFSPEAPQGLRVGYC